MTLFYAHPEDPSEEGFYFKTHLDFEAKADELRETHQLPVDGYTIEFIDGGQMARELFGAWSPGQADIAKFIEAIGEWSEEDTITAIIAMRDGGYAVSDVIDDPGAIEITLYRIFSLKELAEEFVEEGLFGDIPKPLENYIDHDAIARDLGIDDYTETIVAGERLIYRLD